MRLPNTYQEVEYIQSSGTQYFVIWTSFKTSYKSVIDFQMTQIWWDYILSWVTDNSQWRYGIDFWQGLKVINWWSGWTSTISEDTNRHTVTINKSTATVDGTDYTTGYVDRTVSGGIWVFCYNEYTQSSPYNYKSSAKLYKLDIYDENWVHIYDLVPCYRKSDNVIWMYDLVNNQFYTNSWTGTFLKGGDVITGYKLHWAIQTFHRKLKRLPSAYQEVEYIQSSWTQFINTGIVGENKYIIESKFMFTDLWGTSDDKYVIGCASSSRPSYMAYIIKRWVGWGHYLSQMLYGSYEGHDYWTAVVNTVYTVISKLTTSQNSFQINGWTVNTRSLNTAYNTWYNMYIFGRNNAWSFDNAMTGRIYYLKIKNTSNVLVRDFVPCYRKSDGVIWMYDLVNKQFYTNYWSWTFTKWPDVN